MRMVDLIIKKRNNIPLNEQEIKWFIEGYTNGEIPDYQVSSLLMAICFQDMDKTERFYLTKSMTESGEKLDLKSVKGKTVDKHSTGGVGDKTTLALGPLMAACGVKFAKMSGRGLGHTGGTLDKLEAIPDFSIELTDKDFIKQVNDIGIAIIGQTLDMCPADKKLYALRDVTGTVESIPLIASSIMSKKIASGANTIVLDVKVGKGAFMKDLTHAKELAQAMVQIGQKFSRNVSALITDMNDPLGEAVGNSIEVIEAIEMLKGRAPKDFTELVLNLGAHILLNANEVKSVEEGIKILSSCIESGKALNKFKDLVRFQGGNPAVVDDYRLFPQAAFIYDVKADKEGYIQAVDALSVGNYAMKLGAGRFTKDSTIDLAVGVKILKKTGDYVSKNTLIGKIYSNNKLSNEDLQNFRHLFVFTDEKVAKKPIILDIVG